MNPQFFTIIAWVLGVLNTILIIARIIAAWNYSDLDRLLDSCEGQKRTFPIIMPSIIALLSWAWIFTN